jgi:hypothetical protein
MISVDCGHKWKIFRSGVQFAGFYLVVRITKCPPGFGHIMMFLLYYVLTRAKPIIYRSPVGFFESAGSYPGPWTNVTFFNGTTVNYRTRAYVTPGNWVTDIVDGASLTDTYCIAPAQPSPTGPATTSPTSSSTATPTPTQLPSLYPYNPVVADPFNQLAGYYMNGTGYEDTAVLWVGIFEQADADFETATKSFQKATRDFFAVMRQSNKKKIIVDMSGNPGGNAMMPEDLVGLAPQVH